jgi:hypothetical protein
MREGFYKGYLEELEKVGLLNLVGAAAGALPAIGAIAPWAARTFGASKGVLRGARQLQVFTRRPAVQAASFAVPIATSLMASRRQQTTPPPTYQTPQMPQQPPRGYGAPPYGYY